jgi:fatty acid desaturase
MHALFNSLERLTQWPNRLKRYPWGHWAALFLVLLQVWTAWVFFRATSVSQALEILKTMVSFKSELAPSLNAGTLFFLALGILREVYYLFHFDQKISIPPGLKNGLEVVVTGLLVVASILFRGPGSQFIYFQF